MANYRLRIPERFNFAYDVVDEWARISPDKKALLWVNDRGDERQFTFADIKDGSDRAAAYLQQLGIKRGDKVMLMMKRRYQFWMVITALHKLGAVVVPATHLLTEDDIIYRCQAAEIVAIVAAGDAEVLDHVNGALPQCPSVQHCISIGPQVPLGWKNYNQGVASAPAFERPAVANENDDISLMYFTSGTSGEPKMVAHDFLYPLGHIITARYWHDLREDSLHFTLADTGWGKAVWGKYYGQWIVGANVFVYDFDRKFKPVDVLRMIERYHITSFCAPPTVYRFLIREDIKAYDLSSLVSCTNAGEALNPTVFERWYALTGIKLHEAFGQTETTATVVTCPWVEPRPGAMGKEGPGYHIDLLKDDGTSAPVGEQGEIVVLTGDERPVGLFKEYYRDPHLTHENYSNGIYHTGDIAWRDEDGYYWFVGRKDDVIKSSGYRIGPFEVENVIMKHPAVVEVAVTGVPDDIRGMIVKATIVLAKDYADCDRDNLVKDIQTFVKQHTAPYKYPRIIEFVDELPKTISGKIRRVAIRHQ